MGQPDSASGESVETQGPAPDASGSDHDPVLEGGKGKESCDGSSSRRSPSPPPTATADIPAAEKRIVSQLMEAHRFADAKAFIARLERIHGNCLSLDLIRGSLLIASGQYCEAAAAFMSVLSRDETNTTALKAIAQLHHRSGNLEASLSYLKKAVAVSSKDADVVQACAQVLVEVGTVANSRGQVRTALQLYTEALEICNEHAGALYHLGVLAFEQGRRQDAFELYTRAVRASPKHVQAWTNLGVLHRQSGDLDNALRCFQQALQLAPNNAVIRSNMAILYVEMGTRVNSGAPASDAALDRSDAGAESRAYYERALAYEPQNSDALYNLGVLDTALHNYERAIFYYETCLMSSPRHSMAWNNLGVVYQNVDNLERSIQCYQCAIELRPDFHQCLNNLGVIYTTQGHFDKANTLLRAAIAAKPDYAEAHNNIGVLCRDTGLTAEAIEHYDTCMRLCPESSNAFQNRLLALNYCTPGEDPSVYEAHVDWGRSFQAMVQALAPVDRAAWRRPGRGKLRVGYLSPDLYTHSVSYFAEAALLGHHRDRVELFVYCCTPRPDSKSVYLKTECVKLGATWRSILGMGDRDAAELIRKDAVDVLVELTGHTAHNRLGIMRFRPAPVQMTWIGYPNSTGLEAVDYRITDHVSDPEDTQQKYVEKLLRLDGCFLCYSPMSPPQPVAPPPCLENGFITFGSFNALAKITDEVVETWSQVLLAVPKSRLVLKNKPFVCEHAQQLWLQRFNKHGVASWRLDLLPLTPGTDAHMAQYSLMDVSLDPWPYAGTTTTCESLFMGVPCVTLAGKCHAHNVGVTLLTSLELQEEWVARDRAHYVAIAERVAAQVEELAALRKALRPRMLASALCDAAGFMTQLEDKFDECFKQWSDSPTVPEVVAELEVPEPDAASSPLPDKVDEADATEEA